MFKRIFLNENIWISNKISLKYVLWVLIDQYVSIGSGNGLAPSRRQAIIWTNADPVHRCIYVALGGDDIKLHLLMCVYLTSFCSVFLSNTFFSVDISNIYSHHPYMALTRPHCLIHHTRPGRTYIYIIVSKYPGKSNWVSKQESHCRYARHGNYSGKTQSGTFVICVFHPMYSRPFKYSHSGMVTSQQATHKLYFCHCDKAIKWFISTAIYSSMGNSLITALL